MKFQAVSSLAVGCLFHHTQLTSAWQSEQGDWGDCGRLPNRNALLQESNYLVHYSWNDKQAWFEAKVSPSNCQKDIDKDQAKYDKYVNRKKEKTKQRQNKRDKKQKEQADRKQNKAEEKAEKASSTVNKNGKEKRTSDEKAAAKAKKAAKANKEYNEEVANGGLNVVDESEFDDQASDVSNNSADSASFEEFFQGSVLSRKRRRTFKASGFDKLRSKRIGIYYCDILTQMWMEKQAIKDICVAEMNEENPEILDETNGIHIEGSEDCPRNHIWDSKKEEFVRNPCSMSGDLNSWPMTNGGCLNARSLIYVKEGKTNYRFIASGAKIAGIPCGFSIKELLRITAADYDEFHYLQMVRINRNEIPHIPCSFFYNIATNELNMEHNIISKICPNMLELSNRAGNSAALRSIMMGNNLLESDDLSPEFFKFSNVTQYFKLNSNNLESLNKSWFESIPDSKTINIANNTLSTIPQGLFEANTEVQFLLLSRNGMESVPGDLISTMKNLRKIWLNDNHLSELPDEIFSNNKRLVDIYLADNKFSGIKNDHFLNKPYLEVVKMGGNRCVESGCAKEVMTLENECVCEK